MPVKPIPEGHHTVTPYLVVPGVLELVTFLEKAFDAEVTVPPMKQPDGRVGHTEVRIGDSRVMMGEPIEGWKTMPAMVHLYVEDADALYQRAIEAGATSVMEPADQFYGDRAGGVKDASGNIWWLATHVEDLTPEEIQRRGQEAMKKQQGA